MNPSNDLPMGFGIALLQNEKALHKFNAMTKIQQNELIAQSRFVHSKEEMLTFIKHF